MEQSSSSPASLDLQKKIFILSGQSNMSGRGGVSDDRPRRWDGVIPPECEPRDWILRLNVDLRWEKAREPLHADIDLGKVCGVGPGMVFAEAVGGRVGLVPCAVGGTAISEWARGERLYENMVARAKASVADGGEIAALLWYQGESDTYDEHSADVYRSKMEDLIRNLRNDLCLPVLPIIQVVIASGSDKYLERVRESQLSIEDPNLVCVDAKGLELRPDNLHLTTQAQVKLGLMLAEAYLSKWA